MDKQLKKSINFDSSTDINGFLARLNNLLAQAISDNLPLSGSQTLSVESSSPKISLAEFKENLSLDKLVELLKSKAVLSNVKLSRARTLNIISLAFGFKSFHHIKSFIESLSKNN